MNKKPEGSLGRGLGDEVILRAKLVWNLFTDTDIPWKDKVKPAAVAAAAVIYVVSPLDFLPDAIPLVGQIDDLAILIGAVRFLPEFFKAEHVRMVRQKLAQSAQERWGPVDTDPATATSPKDTPPQRKKDVGDLIDMG